MCQELYSMYSKCLNLTMIKVKEKEVLYSIIYTKNLINSIKFESSSLHLFQLFVNYN